MRSGTLISGLLVLLAGIAFFLINMGYGSWDSIWVISKWWPVLLVIIGLGMFNGGIIPRWIAYLIILLAVGAVAAYLIMDNPGHFNFFKFTRFALCPGYQPYYISLN